MALPKKGQPKVLQEIIEPEVQVQPEPEFLQEIKEPVHEETLVEEQSKKKRSRKKKTLGIF